MPTPNLRTGALLALLALAGCTLPPAQTPVDRELPGDAWTAPVPVPASASDQDWWSQWKDPVLEGLVARAREHGTDVRSALASLRAAAAQSDIAFAALFPTADASGSAGRNWSASRGANAWNAQAGGAWTISLAGGQLASRRAALYEAQAQALSVEDVRTIVASEVARNYVNLRLAVVQQSVREQTLANYGQAERIARWRYEAGLTDRSEWDGAVRDLEGARAAVPAARKAAAGYRAALARLTVQNVSDIPMPAQTTVPEAPGTLAVEVPVKLLARRPDLRAARLRVLSALEDVKAAQAQWFPSLNLSGSVGTAAATAGALGSAGTGAGALLAQLTLPVLDWSRTAGAEEQAKAALDGARSDYTAALAQALEDTENALETIAAAQTRAGSLARSEQAADSAASLTLRQYEAGLVDYTAVLTTQRTLLSAREELQSNAADLAQGLVSLYQAMGGGWVPPAETEEIR